MIRMKKKKNRAQVILTYLFLCYSCSALWSQETDTSGLLSPENLQLYLEQMAETSQNSEDYVDLQLAVPARNLNLSDINQADPDLLKRVYGFSEQQVQNLQDYQSRYGPLLTIYELQLIEAFTSSVIKNISQYISSSSQLPRKNIRFAELLRSGRQDILVRYGQTLEKQKGYISADLKDGQPVTGRSYLGHPAYFYIRGQYNSYDRIRFGITAEKDPGEEFFSGTQRNGFDFYSSYLMFTDFGMINSLIIGDYQLDFGQGLTLSTGSHFRNWIGMTQGIRSAKCISRHSGTDEFNFLRGIATTINTGKFGFTAFYSSRKKDATTATYNPANEKVTSVSSFYSSGLHRTINEYSKKGALTERIFGGHLTFKHQFMETGLTIFKSHYSASFISRDVAYDLFGFTGTDNLNAGVDMRMIVRNVSLFGEFSMSSNMAKAFVAGIKSNIFPDMCCLILYRNYQKNYQNLYCKAFGENSENRNEKGLFMGINTNLSRKVTIQAYADYFSFPWLKYQVSAPSKGCEYFLQCNYSPTSKAMIYLLYRMKVKQSDKQQTTSVVDQTGEMDRKNIRLHLSYSILKIIQLENNFDYLRNSSPDGRKSNGYVISQDISVRPEQGLWSVIVRYALFDTESYDDRIYSYEHDVLYSFSVPAYYDKGTRINILGTFHLNKQVELWVRLARTVYANKTSVGSDLNTISGNTKTDIKLQLRWHL